MSINFFVKLGFNGGSLARTIWPTGGAVPFAFHSHQLPNQAIFLSPFQISLTEQSNLGL
jgi:hypothetical protein